MSAPPRRMRALALAAGLLASAAAPGLPFPLRSSSPGEKSPPFALKSASGALWSSAALAGRTAVVCYYRRGQPYSQSALQALAGLAGRFEKRGVAFIAARAEDDAAAPLAAEGSSRLVFLSDPGRDLYGAWGLFILPTTVVLDKDGRVRAAFASDQGDLADKVEEALDDALGLPRAPEARQAAVADAPPPEVGLASRLLAGGKAKEALALIAPLLSSPDPGCALRLCAGRAYLALGRPGEARAQAEACLAKDAASPEAALVMGRAAAAGGDARAAEKWLGKAAALDPGSIDAHYRLGGFYESAGRKDEALAQYRAALQRLLGD